MFESCKKHKICKEDIFFQNCHSSFQETKSKKQEKHDLQCSHKQHTEQLHFAHWYCFHHDLEGFHIFHHQGENHSDMLYLKKTILITFTDILILSGLILKISYQ